MGEDEDRRVERRVVAPPALPIPVLVPAGVAELPGPHDLGADPRTVLVGEGVVDAAGPAGPANHLAPEAGGEHPLVQPLAGVAERRVAALRFAGAEAVERDGEVVDAGAGHGEVLLLVVVAAGAGADARHVGAVDVD